MSRSPVICPSEDCTLYEVVESFMVTHPLLPERQLVIPAGFLFDGLSVPRRLWDIVPPGAPWGLLAACAHDWLCEHEIGRAVDAAEIFHDLLVADGSRAGVNPLLLALMHEAVEHLGPQFGNRLLKRDRRASDRLWRRP